MTQAEFAEQGGIGVSTLKLYEGDQRDPGAQFISEISTIGADAKYIVTGERSSTVLAAEERVLLDGYRALDQSTKKRILAFVLTESGPEEVSRKIKEKSAEQAQTTTTVTATGRGAQAAGRNIVNKGNNGQ